MSQTRIKRCGSRKVYEGSREYLKNEAIHFSGVNTIKIHGGGGRHGLPRLEISGHGGTYKIVEGTMDAYKGNVQEEVSAGTNFIFTGFTPVR